jgi:hypothetical protein
MPRMTQMEAEQVLTDCDIAGGTDYHKLYGWQIDELKRFADMRRYRKPKNANGSRLRYFYAYVDRVAHS